MVDHAAIARERFVESPVAHPSVLVSREVLEAHGGWRAVGWAEDHDLWLRLLEAGVRFAKVDRRLHFWRDRPDRLTRTDPVYGRERFTALKAHFLARGPLGGAEKVAIWGAGPTGRRLARALEGEGRRADAFVDVDPAKIGRQARQAGILPPEAVPRLVARGATVLVAVGAPSARAEIRRHLAGLGLVEGRDFWCCA